MIMKTLAQRIIDNKVVISNEGDPKLGAKIVQAFKDRGFDTRCLVGNNLQDTYYGIYHDMFDFYDNKYAVELGCTILTLSEFIERYPLEPKEDIEKKIIGWKFKDLELIKECFSTICFNGGSQTINTDSFQVNSIREDELKKLGVLEILCEPVYKEVEIPPKGTIVIDRGGQICISKGILKGNELMVTTLPSNLYSDMGYLTSKWEVYKGGVK